MKVRGHKSNVINLTEFKGTFTYTLQSQGSQKFVFTFHVHFRADIHAFRDKPHETPHKTIVPFIESDDSK